MTLRRRAAFTALALASLLLLALSLAGASFAQGQFTPTPTLDITATAETIALATCAANTTPLIEAAAEFCHAQEAESLCIGSGPLYATFAESTNIGPEAFSAAGDAVPLRAVHALQGEALTASANSWGLGVARYAAGGAPVVMVAFGAVSLVEGERPGAAPWQALSLLTQPPDAACPLLPAAVLAQSTTRAPAELTVNGTTIRFDGTIMLQAPASDTVTTSVIAGSAQVSSAAGDEARIGMGEGLRAAAGEPFGPALPFNHDVVAASPLMLLDEIVPVPWPGAVVPVGQVNVRLRPSTESGVVGIAEPAMALGRLGRSADGEWLLVALPDGLRGWIFAANLTAALPTAALPTLPVYDETPELPGPLGPRGRVATVGIDGIYIREGPGRIYNLVTQTLLPAGTPLELLARNAVGDWLRVQAEYRGEVIVGWVYRPAVNTEARIEALVVPDVLPTPPLFTPTTIPGSYGGAFPPPGATFTPEINIAAADAYFVYDARSCPPGREEGVNLAVVDAAGTVLARWEVRTGGGSLTDPLVVAADYTIQIEIIRYYGDTGEAFLERGIPFILGTGQTTVYPGCAAPDPLRFTPTPLPTPTAPPE